MIVRNEERVLARCLSSVVPFVDEIIIVDTGSTDDTKAIAKDYDAQIFDCNPETHPQFFLTDDVTTGAQPPYTDIKFLADFAAARNLSFKKATGDFKFWLDADDIVQGAQFLPKIAQSLIDEKLDSAWLLYDVSRDAYGNSTCQMWRERMVRKDSLASWHGKVHECLYPSGRHRNFDEVKVIHCKPERANATRVAHRNYKILLKVENPEPRQLFYLGNEAAWVDRERAVQTYNKYLNVATWSEERMLARIYLGQIFEHDKDYANALAQFAAATVENPTFPDGWFALARLAYYRDDWRHCVEWSEKAFALGDPTRVLMVDQQAHKYMSHVYYNVALHRIGRVHDALKSCLEGLKACPTSIWLIQNKTLYEKELSNA